MSRIDDLIKQYAPDGVPRRPLGEVGTFIRGRRFTKDDMVEAGVPAIHYGEIYTHYGISATTTRSHVREEIAGTLRYARPGDVIIAGVGETVEDVAKAVAWIGATDIAIHDDSFAFRSSEDPTYMAYVMQTTDFHAQKEKYVARGKVKRVGGENLGKISVPVPPIEIQREIARILNELSKLRSELESELGAERGARRRQYAHYRDTLFSFADGESVGWVSISDLAGSGFFRDGDWVESKDQDLSGAVRLTQLADVGVDVFRDRSNRWMTTDAALRLNCTFLESGDILIARIPEPLGRACQVPEGVGPAVTVVDVAILRSRRDDVLPRYVMYAINSHQVQRKVLSFQAGGTRQRITRKNLGVIEVPIPSLDEQRRIVAVLDKFASLMNDLSSSLPAEIEARRQQYAYYRDRLLSFEEAAS